MIFSEHYNREKIHCPPAIVVLFSEAGELVGRTMIPEFSEDKNIISIILTITLTLTIIITKTITTTTITMIKQES